MLLILLVALQQTNITLANDRPNILFVYTDDQAPWGFGASGYSQAHTPNIDRLASEGANLTNSFVTTPVCSPARASIMTSRYASEYGILDFIPHPNHKLYDPQHQIGLDPESITFAEVLQSSGYTTGLVGKWHLGDWTVTEEKKYHPTNHGYDYFMGLTGGGTKTENPPLEKAGTVSQFTGLTVDILTDHALEFVEDNRQTPFLLCLNYRAPHGKWLPVAEEDWAPYKDIDPEIPNPDFKGLDVKRVKRMTREYLASISGVDRNLGRMLQLLDELKLTQNTIVIFTSDHGFNMGHNGIYHKGNGFWITKPYPQGTVNVPARYRPNMYDNSLKVPAIVKWPNVIKPGTVITDISTSLDWYPTLVDMAGAKLPKEHLVRGRSILPLLKDETPSDWNQDYYGEYSMINYAQAYMRCYRTPKWKLVRDFLNPERDEFYDLTNDPEESHNLIHSKSQQLLRLIKKFDVRIRSHIEQNGDQVLTTIPQTE